MRPLPPGLRWIAFDLDDTLHHFERASGQAAEAVFRQVGQRSGIGLGDLEEAYREIRREAQGGHFSQRRTSREYRAERFAALLGRFGLDPDPQMDGLLDLYDNALGEALELKPGATEALATAKRVGLSTMVISEGPHDAQAMTIERLGIASWVDLLVTSAGEGLSKSTGLFDRALERAACSPQELIYVGDSVARDVGPALALGIATVYVGEEALPEGSPAIRLDLAELGPHLLSNLL